ncbi:hypothetical protein Patl_2083 [Paraglaciecola sp. T6c]|uniref:hypothetical protein n=1 Tax=Pseudoalteromonas atlantica (strain T6c / ATCC BAA-1087) TaxID=3042615 RepID=UPI00005C5D0B|nr:hypothetical protein [Paraglaciecola sp. T6c]ABG40601.1 hypothetical protein Patl_2083 [Paraglaciecola sp. T6c]
MQSLITVCVALIVLSFPASADDHGKHRVSIRQISHQLNQQFPFALDFNGIKAAFFAPKLVLNVLEQHVTVEFSMLAQRHGESINIPFKLTGNIVFDPINRQLILNGLLFDNALARSELVSQSSKVVEMIEQTIVEHFPDITLADFNFLGASLAPETAIGLLIQPRHVQLSY